MTSQDEQARAELRARQGAGARYDGPAAPHKDLNLARRATAYFARLLANLSNSELDERSKLPGVSRRQIIAKVGLEARLIAEAVAHVRARSRDPLDFAIAPSPDEIALASTLPAQALRNLFAHSEVHLNVEWRDLGGDEWAAAVIDRSGRQHNVAAMPRQRAGSLWLRAFQLGAGARKADLPKEFADELRAVSSR